RCAVTLERLITTSGRLQSLPTEVQQVLRQRALIELRRVLSARSQLRQIGSLAREREMRPIVLKGGWYVLHEDGALDLNDIDVLLPDDHARAFAAVLDELGHKTTFSNPRHLSARVAPQKLPVEIHLSLETGGGSPAKSLWRGIVSVPSAPGLWRLSPGDHLWHVLHHATVDHPNRRGRLRDLVLIASAVGECSQNELESVRTMVDRHGYASPLQEVFTMAIDMSTGRAPRDRCWRVALSHYLVRGLTQRLRVSPARSRDLAEATVAAVLGRRERRALWEQRIRQITLEPSNYRFIAWVEERTPRLGRAWRVTVRTAYRTVVSLAAMPLAGAAKYVCRQIESSASEEEPAR
ncbi:MAG: hypothetical protein HKM89_06875, partial [Gemmatimonadales bacterium]|nr:hypothetical protein [Gemmatimonadales bacterium]